MADRLTGEAKSELNLSETGTIRKGALRSRQTSRGPFAAFALHEPGISKAPTALACDRNACSPHGTNESNAMDLPAHGPKSDESRQLEGHALRLLCSAPNKPGTRQEICRQLLPSVFQDPLWRVAFEEIRSLRAIEARCLRDLLPARVINHALPDRDPHEILAPQHVSEVQIDKLFESHPDEPRISE